MTNIEHRSLPRPISTAENLRPRDAEGLGKRRPDASLLRTVQCHVTESRVLSPNKNGEREHGGIRLRYQLHLAARQQERHLLDLCLLGACLLVTSERLVASCKKWTCPLDNHARTFDMSRDIFTCLGHTDWHYFEPCTSVRKRWEGAFGIRSNCICSITYYIKNVVRCVKISEKKFGCRNCYEQTLFGLIFVRFAVSSIKCVSNCFFGPIHLVKTYA